MAAIQPKNTNDIRADIVKEKTAAAGVSLNALFTVFTTYLKPLVTTMDIGSLTSSEHIRELFAKDVTSNGQALNLGTESAHDLTIKLSSNNVWTFKQSNGNLEGNSSNGGDIKFNRSGYGVQVVGNGNFSAAGTTQGTAAQVVELSTTVLTATAGVNDSLKLPAISTFGNFKLLRIYNESGASINIFPEVGGAINDLALNAAYVMADNTHVFFESVNSNRWLTIKSA